MCVYWVSFAVLQVANKRGYPISSIGQRGAIGSGALLWVLVFSLAIYAGYIVVPPYVAYYMLEAEVKSQAEHAHSRSDAEMKRSILEKAVSWSIPIEKKHVLIRRNFDSISVDINYSVRFVFFEQYVKVMPFSVDVDMGLKESSGILHE